MAESKGPQIRNFPRTSDSNSVIVRLELRSSQGRQVIVILNERGKYHPVQGGSLVDFVRSSSPVDRGFLFELTVS